VNKIFYSAIIISLFLVGCSNQKGVLNEKIQALEEEIEELALQIKKLKSNLDYKTNQEGGL
jgi:outer membrane murein-binding lipoprotein Lpp